MVSRVLEVEAALREWLRKDPNLLKKDPSQLAIYLRDFGWLPYQPLVGEVTAAVAALEAKGSVTGGGAA